MCLSFCLRDEEKTGIDLLVDNESIKSSLLDTLYPVETLVPSIPEVKSTKCMCVCVCLSLSRQGGFLVVIFQATNSPQTSITNIAAKFRPCQLLVLCSNVCAVLAMVTPSGQIDM